MIPPPLTRFSQRSQDGVALLHVAEVIFKAAAIDRDEALAGTDTNAGDGGLATTGSERVVIAFAFDDDFICHGLHSLICLFSSKS